MERVKDKINFWNKNKSEYKVFWHYGKLLCKFLKTKMVLRLKSLLSRCNKSSMCSPITWFEWKMKSEEELNKNLLFNIIETQHKISPLKINNIFILFLHNVNLHRLGQLGSSHLISILRTKWTFESSEKGCLPLNLNILVFIMHYKLCKSR